MLTKVVAPVVRRQGFAQAGIVTDWAAIVGPSIAAASHPVRLSFPHGRAEGGTLSLRATGPAALELQHREPAVLERINTYFGYRAVARLRILQGPRPERPAARPPARPLTPGEEAALEQRVAAIADPELRRALVRLGRTIAARH